MPPGPRSPNTNGTIDPETAYDLLGTSPQSCADTAGKIPANPSSPEWRVLRGLAEACQAVQGGKGSWDTAAADYAAAQGRLGDCKGRAALAVLGDVLRFHRQHPSATARLTPSSANGSAVCSFRIASVDVGEDGRAAPGERIRIKLDGIFFDKAELPGGASVLTVAGIGVDLPDVPSPPAGRPDQWTFEVPAPEGGDYPREATVHLDHNGGSATATVENAFTLVSPGPSPVESPEDSPSTTGSP
ncbi:hypothetical protein K4B79_27095 [Streptomyces lincolnensis]|uniref:hypothetical protein n=1 Tax=Streptomyces lincolnensis TaxID=1915 RepID=UPI001E4F487C|nr:hypothetical protein [Streptomyces lincolnensis]MCD7441879.1 hypothetical protein [Streptomyces lincolnensis]